METGIVKTGVLCPSLLLYGAGSTQAAAAAILHLRANDISASPGLPQVAADSLRNRRPKRDQPGDERDPACGKLADRTIHYRHDLAFAEDSTIPKNPHFFITSPTSPNALVRSIAQGVQFQIATFFASDGMVVVHPEPARFFEVPVVGPLPEGLNYIR